MDVLVPGAAGTLGTAVAAELERRGHAVRRGSRSARPGWTRLDTATGDGVAAAVAGADAVIDATNGQGEQTDAVLVGGARRLLAACAEAGAHFVGVSIVGIEDVPLGYYRAKLRQEAVIEEGAAPWSLLRATQFHDLLAFRIGRAARLPVLPLPVSARFQPIDVGEVARRLVDAAQGSPSGRLPDVGGPRVQTLGELARAWLAARGSRRPVLPVPLPGAVGRALRAGALTTPAHAAGGPDFATWLRTHGHASTG
jgi:uncharacterized protein YbjT (DUF2867 family)